MQAEIKKAQPAANERKKAAFQQAVEAAKKAKAVSLGPLGQELAEANEPKGKQPSDSAAVSAAERQAVVQDGQKFQVAANDGQSPVESPVPYTIGMWQETAPVEVTLKRGKNLIHFELKPDSRGVTLKEFTLRPAK